jgi:hypothetical protein
MSPPHSLTWRLTSSCEATKGEQLAARGAAAAGGGGARTAAARRGRTNLLLLRRCLSIIHGSFVLRRYRPTWPGTRDPRRDLLRQSAPHTIDGIVRRRRRPAPCAMRPYWLRTARLHRIVCAARARLLRIVSHRAAAELGGTGDNRGLQPAMALAREYLGVPIGDPDAPRPPLLRP